LNGSNALLNQYRTIGVGLLAVELEISKGKAPQIAFQDFRQQVSFVPVEVLESFLEDLLNLKVSNQSLFIELERGWLTNLALRYTPALGFLLAIGLGLQAASEGLPSYICFTISVCVAAPFAFLWEMAPRHQVRRMRFAQLLSKEINRRRGRPDDGSGVSFQLPGVLGQQVST
jgi:hypothetical protein